MQIKKIFLHIKSAQQDCNSPFYITSNLFSQSEYRKMDSQTAIPFSIRIWRIFVMGGYGFWKRYLILTLPVGYAHNWYKLCQIIMGVLSEMLITPFTPHPPFYAIDLSLWTACSNKSSYLSLSDSLDFFYLWHMIHYSLVAGKCMFLSGLIPRPMNADNDRELLGLGIGFTNIVERTTRASQELTRTEIEEGRWHLLFKGVF